MSTGEYRPGTSIHQSSQAHAGDGSKRLTKVHAATNVYTVRETAKRTLKDPARYLDDLNTILSVSRSMGGERDLDKLLGIIVTAATSLIDADRTSLFIVDAEAGQLWTRIAQGSDDIRLPIGSGIAGSVAVNSEIVNIPDAYKDERFNSGHDKATGYETKSILCMALVNHRDEVVGVIQALNKTSADFFGEYDERILEALCSHAAIAIDTAQLIQRDLERQRLQQEMQIARTIQQSLLPDKAPQHAQWKFAHWHVTCDETGGDYHDFLVGPDSTDVVVGDISGHGIGAALLMSTARAFLRGLHAHGGDTAALMVRLNDLLEIDMADDAFMTMVIVRFDNTGSVGYVSAGHEPPILVRVDGSIEEEDITGVLLGAIPNSDYEYVDMKPMQKGDVMVFMTDGIFEAQNPVDEEEWGLDALRDLIVKHRNKGAQAIIDAVVLGFEDHIMGSEPKDDLTFIAVERL